MAKKSPLEKRVNRLERENRILFNAQNFLYESLTELTGLLARQEDILILQEKDRVADKKKLYEAVNELDRIKKLL